MTLGVTFDHRFMDGFQGGRMVQLFRAYLENPERFDQPQPARSATRDSCLCARRSLGKGEEM